MGHVDDYGCYVDGHMGQYGIAEVVILATDRGWDNHQAWLTATSHLASIGASSLNPLTDEALERLMWWADEAEEWLNENCADNSAAWGWMDGEFYYQSRKWWESA